MVAWENIPQQLKDNGLFCAWKLIDYEGRKVKMPFNVLNDKYARSNDKSTFSPFAVVLSHLSKYYKFDENGKNIGGLGLGIFNGYSAIDIDHCVQEDGSLSEMAQDIIDFCQSYTEYSPSGTGIRIIFQTDLLPDKNVYYINNQKLGLEIYISDNTNKYVTLTGNVIYPNNINKIDITYILNKYMLKESVAKVYDFDIAKYSKDEKLQELWNSIAPGSNSNESEIDLALCNKLAFYLHNDYTSINKAFVSSPYFNSKDSEHKSKWLVRNDYRDSTILKAIKSNNTPNQVSEFTLTDTGNAHVFVEKYKQEIRYNVDNRKWMVYNDQYWQIDVHNNIKNFAELVIEEMKYKAKAIEVEDIRKAALKNIKRTLQSSGKVAMLKEAEHLDCIPVTNSDFDQNDFYFNTRSGVVDLLNKKMLGHNADLMLSKIAPFEISYDRPQLWLKFLSEVFENDQEVIDYIQRVLGYAITGSMSERCMFVLIGDGMNGKSVFLDIARQALGSYATTSNINILLDKKMQNNANMGDVARLNGMRMVVTNEAELNDKLKESAIKTMTSGSDNIVARFLYGEEFEFEPKMKIFMASNYKPRIIGTDLGIWSRIKMILFNVTFDGDKQDKNIKEKLSKEIPQILGWIIKGYYEWKKYGLREPEKFKSAKREYRSEMDIVQKWLDENCVIDSNARENATALYENFVHFVKRNNEFLLTKTMFGLNLSKKFEKKPYLGRVYYVGLRLDPDLTNVLTEEEQNEV